MEVLFLENGQLVTFNLNCQSFYLVFLKVLKILCIPIFAFTFSEFRFTFWWEAEGRKLTFLRMTFASQRPKNLLPQRANKTSHVQTLDLLTSSFSCLLDMRQTCNFFLLSHILTHKTVYIRITASYSSKYTSAEKYKLNTNYHKPSTGRFVFQFW